LLLNDNKKGLAMLPYVIARHTPLCHCEALRCRSNPTPHRDCHASLAITV